MLAKGIRRTIVGIANGQLIAIPRRILDPRRPTGKATKADAEEMLVPYSPVIPIEPKWVVSHKSNVQGVEHILATSTALESTSQLLALGLDMFGSSVSPSGRFDVLSEDFNKVQLVATTAGLMLAIGILKPIVGSLAMRRSRILTISCPADSTQDSARAMVSRYLIHCMPHRSQHDVSQVS